MATTDREILFQTMTELVEQRVIVYINDNVSIPRQRHWEEQHCVVNSSGLCDGSKDHQPGVDGPGGAL